jgi:hypothetical protein
MNPVISLAVAFVGFLVGALLFARVGRWLVSIHEVVKDQTADAKVARLAAAALLSSGPWLLIVVLVLGYYFASQSWAMWAFGGLCGAIVFFSLLSVHLARKAKARARPAA